MGNPSVFAQQPIEPVDQIEHGVGTVTFHLGVPLQVRLNLVDWTSLKSAGGAVSVKQAEVSSFSR